MRLKDREYTPRYPILSCIALENATNKSVIALIDEISTRQVPAIGTLAALIWAGIIADEPKITFDEVAAILEESPGGQFVKAYAECLGALRASMTHLLYEEEQREGEPEKN